LQLTAAKFVGRMRAGQHSAGREELMKRSVLAPDCGMVWLWRRDGLGA
jgi:hypothetical protein